jgi:hypothetical protein
LPAITLRSISINFIKEGEGIAGILLKKRPTDPADAMPPSLAAFRNINTPHSSGAILIFPLQFE